MKRYILIAAIFSAFATPSQAGLTEGIAAATVGNYEQALAEFEPLAASGDAAAQYYLAKLYLEGHGPTNDVQHGVDLMMKSAKGNYPEAQAQLGLMYAMGLGVKVDNALAYGWLTKALTALPDGTRRQVADSNRNAVLQRLTPEQRNALALDTSMPAQPTTVAAAKPETAPVAETAASNAEPAAEPATVAAAAVPAPAAATSTAKPTTDSSTPSDQSPAKPATTEAAATAKPTIVPLPKPTPTASTSSASATEVEPTPAQTASSKPAASPETAAAEPTKPEKVETGAPKPTATQTADATTTKPASTTSTGQATGTTKTTAAMAPSESAPSTPEKPDVTATEPVKPTTTQTADATTAAPKTTSTTTQPVSTTLPASATAQSPSAASKPEKPVAAAAEQAKPAVTQTAALEPAAKPAVETATKPASKPAQEATQAKPEGDTKKLASAEAPTTTAPKAASTKGGVRIQVASLPSEDAAWSEWKRISAEFGDQVTGLTASVETADLGQQGTFYRLQTGPFETITAAKDRCAKMREAGLDCLVVGKE